MWIVYTSLSAVLLFCVAEDVTVIIPQGPLLGVRELVEGDTYVNRFTRVPYATPPLGNLRFEPPGPAPVWGEEVWDGTYYGPACSQVPGIDLSMVVILPGFNNYSEDCLYLNVYQPQVNCLHVNIYKTQVSRLLFNKIIPAIVCMLTASHR